VHKPSCRISNLVAGAEQCTDCMLTSVLLDSLSFNATYFCTEETVTFSFLQIWGNTSVLLRLEKLQDPAVADAQLHGFCLRYTTTPARMIIDSFALSESVPQWMHNILAAIWTGDLVIQRIHIPYVNVRDWNLSQRRRCGSADDHTDRCCWSQSQNRMCSYMLKLLKSIQNLRIMISVQVWAVMCKKKVLDENVRQA
jgi:hypothetical protein